MKKLFCLVLSGILIYGQAVAATGWIVGKPAGSESPSSLDTTIGENNAALQLALGSYRRGANVAYSSTTALTIAAGELVVTDGSTYLMLANAAALTVTKADLDTGTEFTASSTHYVYGIGSSATDVAFTEKVSLSATKPSTAGVWYQQLASFYVDASGNIDQYKVFNTQTNVFDGSVSTLKLKTYYGEVSGAPGGTGIGVNLVLPGGEYGFYPQCKGDFGQDIYGRGATIVGGLGCASLGSSYVTNISFTYSTGTVYAQQRYVTSSGKDYWIFLLIDKTNKKIIASYSAPDCAAYGNGGDTAKVPHPFTDYIDNPLPADYEIVLVEKQSALAVLAEANGGSVATLINEQYFPDMKKTENYVPLHSGIMLGKDPQMVNDIAPYIRVRRLIKLSKEEIAAKQQKEAEAIAAHKADLVKQASDKASAEAKLKVLGLTDAEVVAISGR
jgi:hypothetical protein